ncbi:type II toxin-antitoxin system VapC family toxin [Candidatus Thioglobus sp.]|uniref:type II toxin-antitoxin system VapC family toxin n=1 Tax=Candidatus Thioglobus sp. TaxID=2026721 RepID=UPI001ED53372|nr:type II toxin-antitoxin system VapC family toxin [Candidatus Thioglobus sp.]MBT3186030.1 type II toxin-antitoxin system VapC family toxin [Candidatus Thioglobus sp.]
MFVLDCSVALAWCLEDESNEYADNLLDLLIDQQAIVPSLWHLEVMNVLLMAQRRGRVEQGKIPLILQTLSNLPISTDKREIDINDENFINFANQYQLTSYDATYLYLAKREKIPVATLDKKMQQVAIELGLFLK